MTTGWAGVYLDIAVTIIIGVVISYLAVAIGLALSRGNNKDKTKRFESGNEELGRARGLYVMQYYPYLLIFMLTEPVFVVLFTILLYLHVVSYAVFVLGVIIFAPSLLFALKEAKVLKKWLMPKD
jgi:NADH:ubiquinone oxidoreductase subunit 3 (chain A)